MSEDDRAPCKLLYSETYLSETRNDAKAVWRKDKPESRRWNKAHAVIQSRTVH